MFIHRLMGHQVNPISVPQTLFHSPGRFHEKNGKYAGVTGEFAYGAKHDLKSSAVTVYTFKGKDVVPLKSL